MTSTYAELAALSNFSFLEGASHADEIVAQAAALGLCAVAITDINTLAGIVRGHVAAKKAGIRFIVGARLRFADAAPDLLVWPRNRAAYGRLARLITRGRRRAEKGGCILTIEDFLDHGEGQLMALVPSGPPRPAHEAALARLATRFPGHVWLALTLDHSRDAGPRARAHADLASRHGVPLLAIGDVRYHAPERRPLADVLTCIREHVTIDTAGRRLGPNGERHLKSAAEMARLARAFPGAARASIDIIERLSFSLDELAYDYPHEVVGSGETAQQTLERLVAEGAARRYPGGVPEKVEKALVHELKLIAELRYAPYFLTVHDFVEFARRSGILAQGRGSAANSAVCFCLGITSVDPARIDLLFERFISAERGEPPDIDVDFEHERREEVIQYIYAKYGRERAGLAATVITYRARSAVREVGKALGLSQDVVAALARTVWGWSSAGVDPAHVREAGLDPGEERIRLTLRLADELIGFPRHLSQHVGGFVITESPLNELVPIQNAAMAGRTVVEWDKDDLDALGFLKVDVLGLGMLSCVAKSFALLGRHYGIVHDLASLPREESAVYDMLCRADSLGVFQVESRAQMSMLPRLRPRNFYDLVIEVAIVRPGPIQGDMVHPYLRRRDRLEPVDYPSPELRQVLEKTLGVPLFQEQAMKIAIVAAGFTPSAADELRRAMATFRKTGTIQLFRDKLVGGMIANGYTRAFAERCFQQIEGFGEYGFPESHAASFALIVYVSAWLKCHYPDVFAAALLNSQPMGFYAPAQIVRDAREHGVEVRPVDVNHSDWDCTLEVTEGGEEGRRDFEGESPPDQPSFRRKPESSLQVATCRTARPDPGFRRGDENSRGDGRNGRRTAGRENGPPIRLHPLHAEMAGEIRTGHALRLGLRQIKGLAEEVARQVVDGRSRGGRNVPYDSIRDVWLRTGLSPAVLGRLAEADAFRSLGAGRRAALWAVAGLGAHRAGETLPLFAAAGAHDMAGEEIGAERAVRPMPLGEEVLHDFRTLRLSLKAHPLALMREGLAAEGRMTAETLRQTADASPVSLAGLVLVRQRPGTARGVIFATLEDETGIANVIIWPKTFERFRRVVLSSRLLGVAGRVQRQGIVIHVVAGRLDDLSARLDALSEDGAMGAPLARAPLARAPLARADEVRRPAEDPREITIRRHAMAEARARAILPPGRNFH
jgi:error-prone DNA polymerase